MNKSANQSTKLMNLFVRERDKEVESGMSEREKWVREREIKKRKIGKEKRGLGLEKIFEIRKRKKRKKKRAARVRK